MKVLLIDVNCKNSSTGKIVYNLYQRLREDGHQAAICYGRGKRVDGENIFKFGLDFETYIHAGLSRISGLNGYFSPLSTRRLIRFIETFQPDVVHIHELHAYFVNIKPLINYLKSKKIRIIWTFHCEYMYTGKCGYAYKCENWKETCGNCPKIKRYPKSLFFDFTKKMFRDKKALLSDLDFMIVTPSQWLADRVKMSFLKDKKITVIHNGIDADHVFYPRSAEKIESLKEACGLTNQKIVLSVAPDIMSDRKGGKTVLEISKRFVGENIRFVLIGADRDETIEPNVTLIKRTNDQDELAMWYSAADVFLICSKQENFPTTCLEAVCCGTPVVGIDAGGTKETVPAPYGVFCDPTDLDGLEQAIRRQILMKQETSDISKIGQTLYNQKTMYLSYLALYESQNESLEG